MIAEIYGFKSLLFFEAYILILLALGLLGARFYFSSFMRQDEKYKFSHILFLMLFTVFSAELILVFIGLYFYSEPFAYIQLDANEISYWILLPHFVFFSAFCYFLYWLFKLFQNKQNYYLQFKEDYEKSILKIEERFDKIQDNPLKQNLIFLLSYENFHLDYLKELIFKDQKLLFNPRIEQFPFQIEQSLEKIIEKISLQYKFQSIDFDNFTVIKIES